MPWLSSCGDAHARNEGFVRELTELGVRTGYARFWIGPKYTFVADGRLTLSGELGPDVSWAYPKHWALVRAQGPDALVVDDAELAGALADRLAVLGVGYARRETEIGLTVFASLTRRVSLEELEGYHLGHPAPAPAVEPAEATEP